MTKNTDHKLHRDWRLPRIEALQTDALVIREALQHLEDLVTLFEYDQKEDARTETLTLIGRLRDLANGYESEAENLTGDVETEKALVQ